MYALTMPSSSMSAETTLVSVEMTVIEEWKGGWLFALTNVVQYFPGAAEYLYFHRILVQPNDKNYLNGLWGKLAAEILMQNWDTALEEVKRLQTFIDESTFSSSLQMLQQRTWLIHWSLFVFFNHPKGRELIIEMFLYQKQYLNAIQTTCPWILRYLSTAVIINKGNRRNVLKDLVKVIQEELYTYHDPITSFIEDLYVKFDFDGAQQKLRECETVLVNDFFLVACLEDFIENSRYGKEFFFFFVMFLLHYFLALFFILFQTHDFRNLLPHPPVHLHRDASREAEHDPRGG